MRERSKLKRQSKNQVTKIANANRRESSLVHLGGLVVVEIQQVIFAHKHQRVVANSQREARKETEEKKKRNIGQHPPDQHNARYSQRIEKHGLLIRVVGQEFVERKQLGSEQGKVAHKHDVDERNEGHHLRQVTEGWKQGNWKRDDDGRTHLKGKEIPGRVVEEQRKHRELEVLSGQEHGHFRPQHKARHDAGE